MSVKVSSWVWEHSQATGNDRLVLLCIADIANDDGEALSYPRSQSFIQRKTHLSRSAVRARLKSLVDLGELELVDQGTGRVQSGYRIPMRGFESNPLDSDGAVPESNPQGVRPQTPHHPVLIPSSPVPIPSASLALVSDDPTPDELFDRFWALYPRKVGKPQAKRAFRKAMKAGDVMDISAGLKRWVSHWETTDPQFTPHPTTWLNREGWNDPLPESKAAAPKAADTIVRWATQ